MKDSLKKQKNTYQSNSEPPTSVSASTHMLLTWRHRVMTPCRSRSATWEK